MGVINTLMVNSDSGMGVINTLMVQSETSMDLFTRHGTDWSACRSVPRGHVYLFCRMKLTRIISLCTLSLVCTIRWGWDCELHEDASKMFDELLHRISPRRTVHGRNHFSGWEDFRNCSSVLQRSVQTISFHERGWDVGQERCSETGPLYMLYA